MAVISWDVRERVTDEKGWSKDAIVFGRLIQEYESTYHALREATEAYRMAEARMEEFAKKKLNGVMVRNVPVDALMSERGV